MSELLPCPFCGGGLVSWGAGHFRHPVSKCILANHTFPKGHIGQWNRRALPATPAPDVAGAARVLLDWLPQITAAPIAEMSNAMNVDFHPAIGLRGFAAALRQIAGGDTNG